MLSFEFTREQAEFHRELTKFSQSELAPKYLERASAPEFAWDAHRQLAQLGVLGISLPEEFGGTGAPIRSRWVLRPKHSPTAT